MRRAEATSDACGLGAESVSGSVEAAGGSFSFEVVAEGITSSSSVTVSISSVTDLNIGTISTNIAFDSGIDIDLEQQISTIVQTDDLLSQFESSLAPILNDALNLEITGS